ncbi:site-specific integrase [Methylotenera sp.]|uniref:site-specific integrase n=1 Tax=Methylotenera sp. TaxID=2051956 RepID=UPI002733C769|nr:site-specific integrase [Methylotenera sp.]MDP3777682.1 site-specific integrase [Methylotenera sp.]
MNVSLTSKTKHERKILKSKFGYEFDLYGEKWKLDGSLSLNWKLYDELNLEQQVAEGMRLTLAVFAMELSASYTSSIFRNLREMFIKTNANSVSVATIQNYLGTLKKDNEYKLGALRAFFLDWDERGNPGLDADVAPYMESLRLSGMEKGKAVSKGCPHTGAYSMQEQQAILTWAVNAYDSDKLNLKEYTWLIANIYLGSRPVQLRSSTKGDLNFYKSQDGQDIYKLERVGGKQRNAGFREVFDEIEIDEDLALLLQNQSQASIRFLEKQFGESIPSNQIHKIPIFLSTAAVKSFRTLEDCLHCLVIKPDYLFMRKDDAVNLMETISIKCEARTTRLNGEYISLRSRRFRYTVATNARRRGLGARYIAKILGHKDMQNVKVYVENTSETVDIIDEAMTTVLAPLAQAFAGTLIKNERDAIRANDPRSRIKSNNGSSVGNCGEFGFCASGGRQCYLCSKFQPWIHGQHEKVLESVLKERESLRARGASDFVIQSTDNVLMAIKEVVLLCEQEKNLESGI